MAYRTGITWCDSTVNFWTGCEKVSEGCKFCVAPDTLILYSDWTWKPIKDVKQGDVLLGFNETGKGIRRTEKSIIEGVEHVTKEAVEITTDHTQIICSLDHPFLSAKGAQWIEGSNLRVVKSALRYTPVNEVMHETTYYKRGYIAGMTEGDGTIRWNPEWENLKSEMHPQCYWKLTLTDIEAIERTQKYLSEEVGYELSVVKIESDSDTHKDLYKIECRKKGFVKVVYEILEGIDSERSEFQRGYLSGIFDAEGSLNRHGKKCDSLRICNYDEVILNRIERFSARFDLDMNIERFPRGTTTIRLKGNAVDKAKFLAITCPSITRKMDSLIGFQLPHIKDTVRSIRYLGERELIDIQTSSKTFYANGLSTHNCYMYRDKSRWNVDPKDIMRTSDKTFNQALKWTEPRKIFTCSYSDFFIEYADVWRADAWEVIRQTPQHAWQILTKRPENMANRLPEEWDEEKGWDNVWLGVSVENQKNLKRAEILCETIAQLRFISCEPLLEPIDLTPIFQSYVGGIKWVIIGAESGFETGKWRYRECEIKWIEDIIAQCDRFNISVFVKQLGSHLAKTMELNHKKGGDSAEWPASIQRMDFPQYSTPVN